MNRPDLRERTRLAVRAEISQAAMQLFLDQGFEATTIDQIAAAVGISRRSLFRYFSSKEDIAVANVAERGRSVRRALEARPAGEGPWQALRAAAFESEALDPAIAPEEMLRMVRLLHESPSLHGFRLKKQKDWQDLLAPELARRLGAGEHAEARARGIVAAALACLDAAVDLWAERGGKGNILDLFDEMITAVRS